MWQLLVTLWLASFINYLQVLNRWNYARIFWFVRLLLKVFCRTSVISNMEWKICHCHNLFVSLKICHNLSLQTFLTRWGCKCHLLVYMACVSSTKFHCLKCGSRRVELVPLANGHVYARIVVCGMKPFVEWSKHHRFIRDYCGWSNHFRRKNALLRAFS